MLPWALFSSIKSHASSHAPPRRTLKKLQPKREIPLLNLPPSLFSLILNYLSSREALSLLLTCKAWSEAVVQGLYQQPRLHSLDSFMYFSQTIASQSTYYPYARFVRLLELQPPVSDELLMGDLDHLLSVTLNLEAFCISSCPHLSNLLVSTLSMHVPKLSTLKLEGCNVSMSFLGKLFRGCPSLKVLDLTFAQLSLSVLPLILQEAPDLECLNLRGLLGSGQPWPKPVAGSRLKRLNLSRTRISDEGLLFIALSCPLLSCIHLESCTCITDTGIYSLAHHLPLQSLDMSLCTQLTDVSLQALQIHCATSLCVLYAHGCTLMTLDTFSKLSQGLPRLLSLGHTC